VYFYLNYPFEVICGEWFTPTTHADTPQCNKDRLKRVIGTRPKNHMDLRNDKVQNLKKQYQLTKSKITKSNYIISIL
jgi:hypothetical protein